MNETRQYRPDDMWSWHINVISGIACDSQDRIYVLRRYHKPGVFIFDNECNFLKSWGENLFEETHGIWMSPHGYMYCTDTKDHTVTKLSLEGEVLMTLGTKGKTGALGKPFNMPTRAVESPSGYIYVSDGYGQQRVHKFASDGTLLLSWGEKGNGPGQFDLPHSIWVDRNEQVYVLDRSNDRIEIFDSNGRFLREWTGFLLPSDIFIDTNDTAYVCSQKGRITVLNLKGDVLARLQSRGGHGICVDSKGSIYVAELHLGVQKFVPI